MFFKSLVLGFSLCYSTLAFSQSNTIILKADRVFDGVNIHANWSVTVDGNRIIGMEASSNIQDASRSLVLDLGDVTLMPGMIEGHSHLLLHPYNEVGWNDQVLKESIPERSIRAANHALATLMAGVTTVRDLGAEGAGYADIGVKASINKGVIPGPRMFVAGPAIVATGSYGPKGFADHVRVPLGAEEADGVDDLIRITRDQIGKGADVVKVYADYRWGPFGKAMPTFTIDELKTIVEIASSSGRSVVAHAATAEGMRRATLAGVQTIEHGDAGTREVFQLMKDNGVALCPTLAAGDAISQYRGWKKGSDPDPERIVKKKASFKLALEVGVPIVAGGDVGVYPHGDNVREWEMMVAYGMSTMSVLKSITSDNARLLELNDLGQLKIGAFADIIAVKGDPSANISDLRNVSFVMKDGVIEKE